MGPMGVVVGLVLSEESHQMSAAGHQREVQQLVPDRSDEPLGEGVGLGSADRRQNHPGIVGSKHLVERACELGITVTNQEPVVIQSAFDREVARLLGKPPAIQVGASSDGATTKRNHDRRSRARTECSTRRSLRCSTAQRMHASVSWSMLSAPYSSPSRRISHPAAGCPHRFKSPALIPGAASEPVTCTVLHQRNHQRNEVDSGHLLRPMRQERQERAAQRHC